jgi:hypothetical protein
MAGMSILDDAIREHLELKRAHGANEAELKKLEDEAFGPPGRPEDPDPYAEAPTEFLGTPAIDAGEAADEATAESGDRRAPNITDLQEAPPPKPAEPAEEEPAIEQQTMPVPHPEPEQPSEPESQEELAPVAEVDAGPSTEEREAIADQPTEFFDVEAEMEAGAEKPSPTDEQLLDSQISEPRLAPTDPLAGIADTGPDAEVARPFDEVDDDDDFFSEQRLSDELDRALEAPVTDEHDVPEPPAPAEPTDEHHVVSPPTPSDEHDVIAPVTPTDEHEAAPPPPGEEPTAIYSVESEHAEEDAKDEEDPFEPETGSHEDVLEDTPKFLEDAPEDDDLWFEQKPPKDFDFDD